MAEIDGRAVRIQVTTSRCRKNAGWEVALVTRGGNQSWSGVAKLFSATRCEYLFVLVGDGRRWFIPSAEVAAKYSIVVGPPKWSRFEIEPGQPFEETAARAVAL